MAFPSIYRGIASIYRGIAPEKVTPELRASIESPSTPITGKELLKLFGIAESSSGISVSPEGALTHPAVYACVKVITESLAMLPIEVFQYVDDGKGDRLGKARVPNHPLWPLLSELPNPEMTSFELIEALVGYVLLRGNAFSHVVRNRGGQVIEIWPLRPDRVWVYRKLGQLGEAQPGGDLTYIYTPYGGTPIEFAQDEIWHIKGLSPDGLLGYSPIQLQADAIGAGMATDKYGARFFANDARPGGVLQHPGALSDKAYARLQTAMSEQHQGFSNAHKAMILEEGMAWQTVGIAPEAAQFLQTREWSLSDMGRIFRIPAHKLDNDKHPSRLTTEGQAIEFVQETLMPWTRRIELSGKRDLLRLPSDKPKFIRFRLAELLRGDIAGRTTYYASGRQNGYLSANDVRLMEDMNTIGDDGDHYMVPVNMVPASQLGKTPAADPGAAGPPDTAKGPASLDPAKGNAADLSAAELRDAYAPLFADAVTRILKREKRDVLTMAERLFKRNVDSFEPWLEKFYADHSAFVVEAMGAPIKSYVRAAGKTDLSDFAESFTAAYAAQHAALSRSNVLAAVQQDTREAKTAALEALFSSMLADRPAVVGDQLTRGIAIGVYDSAIKVESGAEDSSLVAMRALGVAERALDAVSKREAPVMNFEHHTHIDPGAIQNQNEYHSHIDAGAVQVTPEIDINVEAQKRGGVEVVYDGDNKPTHVLPIED